jgi:hypothetical protein
MDIGDTKAEHGGFHEGAIGAGVFAGPAVGALSLYWFPQHPEASAVGVCGLLMGGFAVLTAIWWRDRARRRRSL